LQTILSIFLPLTQVLNESSAQGVVPEELQALTQVLLEETSAYLSAVTHVVTQRLIP
jgi:hypothetical protein